MKILDTFGHDHALGILPWALANAVARIDAFSAARLGRTQIGAPIGERRTRRLRERLAMGVCSSEPAEISAVALANGRSPTGS